MTDGAPQTLQVVLSDEDCAGRIRVEIESFVNFNAEIDGALRGLVAKWGRRVPPAKARGPGKRSRNRRRGPERA